MKSIGSYIARSLLPRALERLGDLPTEYRPHHFGTEEDRPGVAKRTSDTQRYRKFVYQAKSVFFLFAEQCRFVVTPHFLSDYATIFVDSSGELPDPACGQLLDGLATAGATFAFACQTEEYHHRNRYTAKFGVNEIEAWVGRDLGRYLPGVYWLSAFDRDLAARCDVRSLSRVGAQLRQRDDGGWIAEMPGGSRNWAAWRDALDALLCADARVFSLTRIRPELDSAESLPLLLRTLQMWR